MHPDLESSMRRLFRVVAVLTVVVWVGAASVRAQSPAAEFYLAYRQAFQAAKTIDELSSYLSASARKQIEATPAEDRGRMFEFMKVMGARHDLKILSEEPSGDGIALTIEATGADGSHQHGTITLVREEGSLKIVQERWGPAAH
jgi:hypothetical protein